MKMKILTWNIYKRNNKLKQAKALILFGGFDVVCLQEVPVGVVGQFTALAPYSHVADEYITYRKSGKVEHLQLVMLSRHPIIESGSLRHGPEAKPNKRYTTFDLDFQYIDIKYGKRKQRIYNVHFKCVAPPAYRLQQLEEVLSHIPKRRKAIICGDFNSFGRVWSNVVLPPVFRHNPRQLWINERKALEARFAEHQLHNALAGKRTFSKFPLQLDYILVPDRYRVTASAVHSYPYGSDHYPVEVKIKH